MVIVIGLCSGNDLKRLLATVDHIDIDVGVFRALACT